MSGAKLFNLVEGGHTTKNGEKDHIVTDLVVIDVGGIHGRSVHPLSSASGTLETVDDSRPGTNSNLDWNSSFRNNPCVVLERI